MEKINNNGLNYVNEEKVEFAKDAIIELSEEINELKKKIILRDLMIKQQNVIIKNVAEAIKETKYYKEWQKTL